MGRTILGATLLVLGGIFVVFIALMLLAALVGALGNYSPKCREKLFGNQTPRSS